MSAPPIPPARARQFLLGTLPDGEREDVERACIASAAALDEVTAAEDALIEDYLDDTLAPEDRRRFDAFYLASDANRNRVDTVRRLRHGAAGSRPRAAAGRAPVFHAASRWRYSALGAAAALVIVAGGVRWWHGGSAVPGGSDPQQALARPHAAPPAGATPRETPSAPPTIVAWSLAPIATRSDAGSRPLVIPPDATAVELTLEGTSSAASATRVVIQTVGGRPIWSGPGLAVRAKHAVTAQVSASRLPPDDYIVVLFGGRTPGQDVEQHRYFLRVRGVR